MLDTINTLLEKIVVFVWGPQTVLIVVLSGVFFTIFLRGIQIRGFIHALKIIFNEKFDKNSSKGTTHFQALCTALSSTVGLGNIAGVAVAIKVGGPGACFWMIVCGFLGMVIKYSECSLSTLYRNVDEKGNPYGGPMYYITKGLHKRYSFLAYFYAIACVLGAIGAASMFQSNQVASILNKNFLIPNLLTGFILCVLTAVVIIGGIKRIVSVTSKIVPFMCAIYMGGCLLFIILNYDKILPAFYSIFEGAFLGLSAAGGAMGVSVKMAISEGFKRGIFSSESGIGTASIAHATVNTDEPLKEGFVSLIEPFIDTVVICTLTAMTVIIGGLWNVEGLTGVNLTAASLNQSIEGFGTYFIPLAVSLFCYSTLIGWFYYSEVCVNFLFRNKKRLKDKVTLFYKVIYCSGIIIGSLWGIRPILNFTDIMVALMILPNLAAILMLSPVLKKETVAYMKKYF